MRTGITRALERHRSTFSAFTPGQKVVAVVGTLALLLAGFMVFRWASAPSYAPLYTNLSPEDASAVVEQLQADGIEYEIGGGGGTISVPRNDVYATRIALSGEGIPSGSGEGGYALLDGQDISTSQFKEQTDFKRAMEGELAATIEAIDGVETAVVHLALPPKQVFAEEQDPATASVLVDTRAGTELGPDQVQAIVHLVASSIDGLDPAKVTVADSAGRVLSQGDDADGLATGRYRQVEEYQDQLNDKVQAMLDRVFGPGNSSVQVTAVLDFDHKVTETTTYGKRQEVPTLSESVQRETYSGGAGGRGGATGVVGPDAQLETNGTGTDGSYDNSATVRENGVDKVVEQAETAPGAVKSLHAAVVVDTNAPVAVDATEIDDLVSAAIGLDTERGDTIATSVVPFDTSVEDANAAALEKAQAAEAAAARDAWIRNGVLAGIVLLLVGLAWRRARRNARAREDATSYVVEQLRQEQADRAALQAAQAQLEAETALALAPVVEEPEAAMRDELAALVERQPDEVAALLRGWLVERP